MITESMGFFSASHLMLNYLGWQNIYLQVAFETCVHVGIFQIKIISFYNHKYKDKGKVESKAVRSQFQQRK